MFASDRPASRQPSISSGRLRGVQRRARSARSSAALAASETSSTAPPPEAVRERAEHGRGDELGQRVEGEQHAEDERSAPRVELEAGSRPPSSRSNSGVNTVIIRL